MKIKTSSLSYFILILALLSACGVPKEVMNNINSSPKELMNFPTDYCLDLPRPTFQKWDDDYNVYNKYLTKEIMKTQVGMSFNNKGVQTWFIYPGVRTHTQLDTHTIISDSKKLIGNWRIICNRKISFTDSAAYADKKIYRSEDLIYNEKDADVFLSISEAKFKLYGTETGQNRYKRGRPKNYSLINGRFLMLFGSSKATGSMSQIGIDRSGNLIINSYLIQERKVKDQYITYQSTVTQAIFKKQ